MTVLLIKINFHEFVPRKGFNGKSERRRNVALSKTAKARRFMRSSAVPISTREVARRIKVDPRTAKQIMKRLKLAGEVQQVETGNGRGHAALWIGSRKGDKNITSKQSHTHKVYCVCPHCIEYRRNETTSDKEQRIALALQRLRKQIECQRSPPSRDSHP